MAKLKRFIWNEAQSYGVLDLATAGSYRVSTYKGRGYHIYVTSNSKQWVAYAFTTDAYRELENNQIQNEKADGLDFGRLAPEYKLMVVWAKREFSKMHKAGTLSMRDPITKEAQELETSQAMTLDNGQAITYSGFIKVRMTHSFEAFHDMVNESVDIVAHHWDGWIPRSPKIYIHTSGRVMGTAYNPGGSDYTISLNRSLVTDYDMNSILRVVLHEWCHHYRNRTWALTGDAHDAKFCDALALVDPTVAGSKRSCTYFTDAIDPAIAAQKATKKVGPVFAPNAGYLEIKFLKDGSFSCSWKPVKGYKWSAYNFKVNDIQWTRFTANFAPQDWENVQVIFIKGTRFNLIPSNWTLYDEAHQMTHKGKAALTVNLLQTTVQFMRVFSRFDHLQPIIDLVRKHGS